MKDTLVPGKAWDRGTLSPYLFVLCMEKLSHLIIDVVDNGHWDCLRTGRYGPKIPHLMFDDDVLLFGKASEQQIVRIKDVLDTFCESNGQKFTYEKSSILFSKKYWLCD